MVLKLQKKKFLVAQKLVYTLQINKSETSKTWLLALWSFERASIK